MRFLNTVFLFASGSMAAMGTAHRRARAAERLARYQSQPAIMVDVPPDSADVGVSAAKLYAENWAGAVKTKEDLDVSYIRAQITVPVVAVPANGSSSIDYHAAAWVGIDGYKCTSSILQTGIDIGILNGTTTVEAWFEWYPAPSHVFDLDIRPGHILRFSIRATAVKMAGLAIIENVTTGKSAKHIFAGIPSPLCTTDAEWIIERYRVNDEYEYVPFADFNTLTFSHCETIEGGRKAGLAGSDVLDLLVNQSIATDCNIQNDFTLRCDHR